jgi:hypothetical protein
MYVIPYKRDATLPLRAVIRKVVQNFSNFVRFIYSPRAFQRVIVRIIRTRIAQNRFFPFDCSSVLTLKRAVLTLQCAVATLYGVLRAREKYILQ